MARLRVDVVEAGDGKLQPLIGGQMRRADNTTCADDDNRAWSGRGGPSLAEMRQRRRFRTYAANRRRGQRPAPVVGLFPVRGERQAPSPPTTRLPERPVQAPASPS